MKSSENQLDLIFVEIGGFGKYQIYLGFLLMLVTMVNYFSALAYIFETLNVNHRCFIDSCDSNYTEYNTKWLKNAVPFTDKKPKRCTKFQHTTNSSCDRQSFNRSNEETCDKFVYETTEKSIIHDFDLQCDHNVKTLTYVGTTNGIGKLVGLPIAGLISDRFGRKKVLIISSLLVGVIGLARSFSPSYMVFLALEFFDAAISIAVYISVYVLGSELVEPRSRSLLGTVQFVSFSLGGAMLGLVAWQVQSWRTLLQIVYPLNFCILLYIWLLPESIRWLLVNNKHEEAKKILQTIARVNNKYLSEENILNLSADKDKQSQKVTLPFKDVLKSKILTIRCVVCSFCWMSGIFSYYGLTITSTTLSTNHYLDFILTSIIETPAYIITHFLVDMIGRKWILCGSFMLSSITNIAYIVLPIDTYWFQLVLYLFSKFCISMSVFILYIATNEMFPTPFRQTLLSVCSMCGRIGNILAPQLILLQEVWKPLPLLMFAVLTGISGILMLCLPETKGINLPDTVEEAENIGAKKI